MNRFHGFEKRDDPHIRCPHCNQIKIGWRLMANHMIHCHGQTAEAGAAYTSQRRLSELLSNCVVKGNAPPPPKPAEEIEAGEDDTPKQ